MHVISITNAKYSPLFFSEAVELPPPPFFIEGELTFYFSHGFGIATAS